MTEYIVYWLIAANLIAFVLMVLDKQYAQKGDQRTPESTLLFWAFAGGAFGTVAAAHLVRHKTHKQPFATWMLIWLWLDIILLTLWALGILGPLVTRVVEILEPIFTWVLARIAASS